ncbi:hypothetical protein FACS1894102_0300 [Spirochaetia bacterium]|nr:hypothetical protein FACS1894102_0300 [Spirochaetia bacterium]
MIEINAVHDLGGVLQSCSVEGHANTAVKGSDIVCAAVSALIIAASETLSSQGGIKSDLEAPGRGLFYLKTSATGTYDRIFLKAVGDFLINGLKAVAREYPQNCSINIVNL